MSVSVRDRYLMITSQELLETTVGQLQILVDFLSDQLRETDVSSAASETRACEEILRAVSTLIQIHQSAGRGPWRS